MLTKNQSPTISDVAERAGVSIATVSRVINGNARVVPETADRVRAAIYELQFVPRPAARTLASRKTNTIGLVFSEIRGAFFPQLLKGIESQLHEAGYELLVYSTHSDRPINRKPIGEHNTDGLLVFTTSLDKQEIARLHKIHFPMVLMHETPPEGLNIPVITVENKDGAAMLVSHLIEEHDRRRIVFLRGPEGHEDSHWRERGYREALATHGIPVDETLISSGEFTQETAYHSMRDLLRDGIKFDAVFAGDDDASIGVYRALKEAKRLIPDDVAVVGFDDVEFAGYISPPLTTIRAPIEEVGREAVRQLTNLLNGDQVQSLVLKRTELIIRESCGCKINNEAPGPARR